MKTEILRRTYSVCQECKKRIPAQYIRYGQTVYLEKECLIHGKFSTKVWQGTLDFEKWCADWELHVQENTSCPENCGLCEEHKNKTCCAILDVTTRCNLSCRYCFANGGYGEDMPIQQVFDALEDMYEKGIRFLHLSGGEPTVRNDLEKIISYASNLGYEYLQLNTNGLRIAKEQGYAEKLADAGLSSVFLQFDGTNDEIYRSVRGMNLFKIKKQAIMNCDSAEIGVVLVPTVIPGINDDNVGSIIRFAFEHMPAVKGVHFQPVTYTGRYPQDKESHITIPELLCEIEKQTNGFVLKENFYPSECDAALCGFHAEFRKQGPELVHVPGTPKKCCCSSPSDNQRHVKNRWTRKKNKDCDPGSIDAFLQEFNNSSFCISGMAFQDLSNLDINRVMQCSVHVYNERKLIPFCVYHNYKNGVYV